MPSLAEKRRKEVMLATTVAIKGCLEQKNNVHHIIADDVQDLSHAFEHLFHQSRDFH
jgi:hypothetical protein